LPLRRGSLIVFTLTVDCVFDSSRIETPSRNKRNATSEFTDSPAQFKHALSIFKISAITLPTSKGTDPCHA
jgi:hypothetical protein